MPGELHVELQAKIAGWQAFTLPQFDTYLYGPYTPVWWETDKAATPEIEYRWRDESGKLHIADIWFPAIKPWGKEYAKPDNGQLICEVDTGGRKTTRDIAALMESNRWAFEVVSFQADNRREVETNTWSLFDHLNTPNYLQGDQVPLLDIERLTPATLYRYVRWLYPQFEYADPDDLAGVRSFEPLKPCHNCGRPQTRDAKPWVPANRLTAYFRRKFPQIGQAACFHEYIAQVYGLKELP